MLKQAAHIAQNKSYSHYFFLGIGGIGMSAIARYYHSKGFVVGGYDRTPTPLTKELEAEGIAVTHNADVASIPTPFLQKESTLIIRTPAIPATQEQFSYFCNRGFTVYKRAETLGEITRNNRALCVAGTHGKTTTSTILAHLLFQSKVGCNAFLGGISSNYRTNLLLSESPLVVVEADEYDRSFHQLNPYMAIVTAADPDHLDIYGTPEGFREGFEHFTSLIQPHGALLLQKQVAITPRLTESVRIYRYSGTEKADFYADNITIRKGEIYFDFHTPTESIAQLKLGVPVLINIENSVAALGVAWLNGVTADELRHGLASYEGIYRRFNILAQKETIYIDDYAHHPTELKASIASVRALYPNRKITGIFQPHLYSRTRDFADQFAATLSELDEVVLLPIYPARELPIEGVSSEMILEKMTLEHKSIVAKEELIAYLQREKKEVVITLGAGDIDQLVPELTKLYNQP